ncbi:MAG TPA: hypothetical protein VK112_06610, partial [Fodinibius sp.]|nr:hypothetical protein [Fodinibius sp.]
MFVISACNDRLTNEKAIESTAQSVDKTVLTQRQSDLKDKLKATALVLKKATQRPKVLKELRFAIDFYSEKEYIDERVYLAKMFDRNAAYKEKLRANGRTDIIGSFAQTLKNENIST